MAFHYSLFIWIAIFLLLVSMSQVQGCSLVGIDLQNCLVPITQQTPLSVVSCCTTLNLLLEAGYRCLCSLLGPSAYPVFSAELSLSISNCYVSVPPLTHCHEPKPIVLAPPVAAMPLLNKPPPPPPPEPPVAAMPLLNEPPPAPPLPLLNPLLPALKPPDMARGEGFVPLPPKVNEMPLSENSNSSIVDSNQILNSSPLPMIGIPERWDYVRSDGADVKMLVNSRKNLLILVSFWLYCMKRVN